MSFNEKDGLRRVVIVVNSRRNTHTVCLTRFLIQNERFLGVELIEDLNMFVGMSQWSRARLIMCLRMVSDLRELVTVCLSELLNNRLNSSVCSKFRRLPQVFNLVYLA